MKQHYYQLLIAGIILVRGGNAWSQPKPLVLGYLVGPNNTAVANTFIGSGSGYVTTTGQFNTFLGANSGYANTTGENNVFWAYRPVFEHHRRL